MDRRHFLAALISGAVLDPEKLLWKPGKLISIPAVSRSATADEVVAQLIFDGVLYPSGLPVPQRFHADAFTLAFTLVSPPR